MFVSNFDRFWFSFGTQLGAILGLKKAQDASQTPKAAPPDTALPAFSRLFAAKTPQDRLKVHFCSNLNKFEIDLWSIIDRFLVDF